MDRKSFGRQLQKYRNLVGYSQEDLAERIECSPIFISYIERGQKSPSIDTLVKLSNALNVSADVLLGKEMNHFTSEKLRHIEERLNALPVRERQRILDIMDEAISIELSYCNEQEN